MTSETTMGRSNISIEYETKENNISIKKNGTNDDNSNSTSPYDSFYSGKIQCYFKWLKMYKIRFILKRLYVLRLKLTF